MIYLSSIAYIPQEDRPAGLRNARLDSFFSEMLLPHEIAHQWWGNTVSPLDYRSEWLFEAMSSYSALEFLEQSKGRATPDAVLESYRQDLLSTANGVALESAGPFDFGDRLLDNNGMLAWHVIVYEKGAWILHMLRMRLGEEGFRTLQTRLLQNFQNKLVANEDFRHLAEGLVPEDQSDKSLNVFFDNSGLCHRDSKIALSNRDVLPRAYRIAVTCRSGLSTVDHPDRSQPAFRSGRSGRTACAV